LDWQLQDGMSRRLSTAAVNFSGRTNGLGLAEPDGGIQAYHTPQTFTAVDFDMQVRTW